MKRIFPFVLLISLVFTQCRKNQVEVTSLRCENLTDPACIDAVNPHLSWKIQSDLRGEKQTAYQILVASSPKLLRKNKGDLWDSRKVISDQSVHVPYAGEVLSSRNECHWKVRMWDKDGNPSEWSAPSKWSMGLLEEDDWKAGWIGLDKTFPGDDDTAEYRKLAARYLRKEFNVVKKIQKATVYISGLGLYELTVNGMKTGDHVLAPGATQYRKTVFYNTFDITRQLVKGRNAIGVVLGNGRFFAMRKKDPWPMQNYGFPKLIMQAEITYTDGTKEIIVTDDSWKISVSGPITENNEYDGEKYDARLEMKGWDLPGFDDRNWMKAQAVDKPAGALRAQMNEPIRITGTLKPVSVKQLRLGTWIFDMGQNMVGWVRINVKGTKGDTVTLRFAERLKEDGSLALEFMRGAKVTDTYIMKGDSVERWEPRFTYHGFRYVEVSRLEYEPGLNSITGCLVNDDLGSSGSFECSDEVLNQTYRNATWCIRGNYRSFPADCPQRDERMGWLGDRATSSRGESYVFDHLNLYRKWLGDMRDCQTDEGSIPNVCPAFWEMYFDNITWNGAGIMVTEMLYDQYGAKHIVNEQYESMKKWLLYMKNKYMKDGLMPRDNFGDWLVPPHDVRFFYTWDKKRLTDSTLLGTSFYYHDTRIMQRFAKLLGKTGDEEFFRNLADSVRIAYNNHFFNPSENYYSNNTPTANILSLAFGLVPDEKKDAVFAKLVETIEKEHGGHIAVGLMGIQFQQRILTDIGRPDIAMRFATTTDYPSWGYMAKNGATTIWELWNGNTAGPVMNSWNHVSLLGDLLVWMHENVAGIKPAEPGFRKIMMKPLITGDLTYVHANHNSPYGTIVSNWELNKNTFSWNISIPANSSAVVYIPADNEQVIKEGKKHASEAKGVKFIELKDDYAVFEVLSGNYCFTSPGSTIKK